MSHAEENSRQRANHAGMCRLAGCLLALGLVSLALIAISIFSPTTSVMHVSVDRHAFRARGAEIIKTSNTSIEFWGKTVDEDEKPLAGVQIHWTSVEGGHLDYSFHGKTGSVTSEQDGIFYINGSQGSMIGIDSVKKEGYILGSCQKNFGYTDSSDIFKPEKNNSKPFILIRKNKITPLIHFKQRYMTNWDSKPLRYNLRDGGISEDGDLVVTQSRSNLNQDKKYDWHVSVRIHNGTLLHSPLSPESMAPKDGYQSTWETGCEGEEKGGGAGEYDLYIRTTDRQHGRLHLTIYPDESRSNDNLYLEGWINPEAGNRILMCDPEAPRMNRHQ